ncbi:polysaccharide deacetylase family protein [Aneurinibacillus aneurinilyticus]|jgi:peptidoglycan/xylan/chitin deacetylase (PgdA/CDA1 family)|uniref:polysaccharide deacetylase family protein n=1 Tax=Aneurinibacillus aneurinilyticus TaxID=1391 RepID=UPI002E21BA43|nr:polysaccharide deacetylase [Aneurinibacillus aneurinilyticus]
MGAKTIKGAVTASIIFFILFVIYASLQAYTNRNTIRHLEEIQQEKKELQVINEKLTSELKEIKQNIKKAPQQNPAKKVAYLTFDDGPSSNTSAILSILDYYKIKATFFVIGNQSKHGKYMYKRIVAEGHAIGLHSYSHEYRTIYVSPAAFHQDFDQIRNLVYQQTDRKPNIIRFPGGSNNHVSRKYGGKDLMHTLIQQMTQEGYHYFDWNVDSRDAERITQSRDVIIQSVLHGSKNKQKAIILMHDSQAKTTTVEALPAIIEGLRKQGFSFDVLTDQSFTYHFPPAS